MSDHLWFPELIKAVTKTSHLFVNYVAYHRVDDDGKIIAAELMEGGAICRRFCLDQGQDFSSSDSFDIALLVGMERLIGMPRALEHLRVRVNEWAAESSDRRVVVLSRSPRSAYPVGDGSSLVLDAKDLHLRRSGMAEWTVEEYQRQSGRNIPGAARSRGLASVLLGLDGAALEAMSEKIAAQTLVELGPNYIALLDEWVLEGRQRTVAAIDVPVWMQVELILAGVAHLDADQLNLVLFESALGSSWMPGLRKASRASVRAPRDWRELSVSLFEIERLVRDVLAGALERSLGRKWAKQVLSPAELEYIRSAASVDQKFPVHELANPLDYLTLGQLLDLAAKRPEAKLVGLSQVEIGELRRVVPIRNRTGHMRLPRMGDLHTARSTLRLLQMRVKDSARS